MVKDRAAGDQIYIHNDRSDTLIGEIHNENGEHFALCSPVSTSGGSIINSKDDKHQAESCDNEASKPLTSNESQNDTGTTDLAAENVFDPRSAESALSSVCYFMKKIKSINVFCIESNTFTAKGVC